MSCIQRRAAPVAFALALAVALAGEARAGHGGDGEGLSDAELIAAAAGTQTASSHKAMEGDYAEEGAETCMECHDEPPVTEILHRAHAQMGDSRTPFAGRQCETCHGASPQHLETPAEGEARTPVTVVFGQGKEASPVAEQNAVCLDCHESGKRMHWRGSTHQFNDLTCATCHTVHAVRDPVRMADSQKDVCFTCHAAIRAQTYKRSHHPIREGVLACSDCHNPHGSFAPTMLVKQTVNDTCFECHEDKRGPFLWEHEPVREDCTICHTPHGSTQPRLLQTRTPWLCQQCHSAVFHPSTIYDGGEIRSLDEHTIASGCINCHSRIHGSNHPSGTRFTR